MERSKSSAPPEGALKQFLFWAAPLVLAVGRGFGAQTTVFAAQ